MLLVDALNFIVDDGIEAARHDYGKRRGAREDGERSIRERITLRPSSPTC